MFESVKHWGLWGTEVEGPYSIDGHAHMTMWPTLVILFLYSCPKFKKRVQGKINTNNWRGKEAWKWVHFTQMDGSKLM